MLRVLIRRYEILWNILFIYIRGLIIGLNREKYIIRENIIIAINNFLLLLLFLKFYFFITSLFSKTVFLVIINEKVVYL